MSVYTKTDSNIQETKLVLPKGSGGVQTRGIEELRDTKYYVYNR